VVVQVVHVIPSLQVGGAENVLARVVNAASPGVAHRIVTLHPPAARSLAVAAPVHCLGAASRHAALARVGRLSRLLRGLRPDVVQTWLYEADVVGGLAARWAGIRHVVWTIRSGGAEVRRGLAALGVLSRAIPSCIVGCARSAIEGHVARGYDGSKMVYIPNGFGAVQADSGQVRGLRARHGIPADALVIGRVARWHPSKDYPTLLAAVWLALCASPREVVLALAGADITRGNEQLLRLLRQHGLSSRTRLMGPVSEMGTLYAAMDLLVSSSAWEAFPNTVAEAMSHGVPVVGTDAGDTREILSDDALVAPVGDDEALAARISAVLTLSGPQRRELGSTLRRRIVAAYPMDRMVAAYEAIYRSAAA
jgi:glycosyltransferase involved in cell wall biosynthesis